MPAAKAISAAVLDLALNDIKNNTTMVLYTTMTTNPANAAGITGVIGSRAGLTSSDFTVTSGSSVQVNAAASPITASGSGTATCVILKTGVTNTDGVIKAISTGTTVLTSGQQYTPSAHSITFPAAV